MHLVTRNRLVQASLWFAGVMACASLVADEPQQPASKVSDPTLTTTYTQVVGDYFTAKVDLATNQLGIEVATAEKTLCSQLGILGGLVITKSPEGSEGAKAGLQAHDVILSINSPRSEPVRQIEDLNAILANNSGKKIEIGLLRGGKMQLVGITVTPRQDLNAVVELPLTNQIQVERFRIGVHLAEVDDTLRAQLQLPNGQGLVVTEVIENTPAAKAGIQAHDVIVELDGKQLAKIDDINQKIQEIKARAAAAKLIRGGKPQSIEVVPEKVAPEEIPLGQDLSPYFLMDSSGSMANGWQRLYFTRLQDGNANVLFFPMTSHLTMTTVPPTNVTNPVDPRAQVSALKQQLGEMQKVIAALEASLSNAEQKPTPSATEEKK